MDRKKKEPATELMKMVAKKTPQRRKILKDFSPEEAKEILRDVYGSGKSDSLPFIFKVLTSRFM